MKGPKWLKDTVFYEIYPQSFYDTNADGIGDIQGIIEKLDYVKSLGCNGIWLNPWYESPFLDAGYDVTNYYKIAPRYGTNDDAKRLFEEAHKRDMRIIIDLVVGHTSMECEWFKKSQELEKNEFTNRYIWCPYLFWRGDPETSKNEDYYISGYSRRGSFKTNFFWNQPALNYGFAKVKYPWELPVDHPDAKATREEVKNIMRFWLNMGCDGFRVDMAPSLIKRDYDCKENKKFWREVRKMMDKEYPDAIMASEWGNPQNAIEGASFHMDLAIIEEYYALSRQDYYWVDPNKKYKNIIFDKSGTGDITFFLNRYLEDYEKTKGKGYIALFTGNHDCRRLKYNMSEEVMEVYFAFLMTMPGVPFVYYGDEIGMNNLTGLPSKEGGDIRTEARTPMQWNNWENKGFSKGRKEDLYLPVDESPDAPTVDTVYNVEGGITQTLKKLIEIRKSHKALCGDGEFTPIYMKKNKYPFVYERNSKSQKCLIYLNPTEKDMDLSIKYSGKLKPLYEKNLTVKTDGKNVEFKSNPYSIGIYLVK